MNVIDLGYLAYQLEYTNYKIEKRQKILNILHVKFVVSSNSDRRIRLSNEIKETEESIVSNIQHRDRVLEKIYSVTWKQKAIYVLHCTFGIGKKTRVI